ncbi:MAG: hypothetical protein LBT46_10165 [Planctomycetaceae bacterium]|jgi:hypothetical protein|nr:hypothetical protein [Planctomycetaceae bacterium]
MPFDPYSLCPGGRDKKIRFCCNDLLKEIEQIERLLESNQSGACLSYIESIEKEHYGCACLTAAKLSVYRLENRWQDALPLAKAFHEKEPDNPVASAEYALALAVTGQAKTAVSVLIDAYESAKEGTAHSAVINAALQVGATLLLYGQVLPVTAIGNQLKHFPSVQEQANALLYRASSLSDVPLLLRDLMFEENCPGDFPGKKDFDDASALIGLMRWKSALTKLEPLTKYADRWSGIWRNVAAVRFWLLENESGKEALKQYTLLPNVPLEDAVDAATTLLLVNAEPLGDSTNILQIEYPITDAEKAFEKMLSAPVFYRIEVPQRDPNTASPNVPPPKGGFVLLDKPFPKDTEVTLQNAASQQAACLLFGKETDREARLIVSSLLEEKRFEVEKQLAEVLGDTVQTAGNVLERRPFSQSVSLVQYRFRFSSETMPDAETVQKLQQDYYAAVFIGNWCQLPLGLLDGKTPNEAAKELQYRVKLLAAIQYLELMMDAELGNTVCNDLRQTLGLPVLGTIAVPDSSDYLTVFDGLPVWRWYRLDAEKVPTEALMEGLQIAGVMKEPRASVRFAKELLNRPMDSMPFEARLLAFESLLETATAAGDIEEALLWIDRGRNESAAHNIPDAAWCLHEIPLRLHLGQGERVQQLVSYIVKTYKNDANVMQALRDLYVQLGVLNPDGTVSAATQQMTVQKAAAVPEGTQSTGLWTPEQTVSANTAGGSTLWVPE